MDNARVARVRIAGLIYPHYPMGLWSVHSCASKETFLLIIRMFGAGRQQLCLGWQCSTSWSQTWCRRSHLAWFCYHTKYNFPLQNSKPSRCTSFLFNLLSSLCPVNHHTRTLIKQSSWANQWIHVDNALYWMQRRTRSVSR